METGRLRMGIPLSALGAGLLLALSMHAAPAAVAAEKSSAACSATGTRTLAANPEVRLYREAPPPGQGATGPVYGCLKSSGKSRRIGPTQRRGWSASIGGPFALKGTWAAAIEDRQVGKDTTRVFVAVRDIRAQTRWGRRCLIGSADRPSQLPAVRLLLVNKDGALAWVAITPSPTGRAPLLGVCDAQGTRILDSGAGLEIESVELRGSTLSWMNAGGPRSAQLG